MSDPSPTSTVPPATSAPADWPRSIASPAATPPLTQAALANAAARAAASNSRQDLLAYLRLRRQGR